MSDECFCTNEIADRLLHAKGGVALHDVAIAAAPRGSVYRVVTNEGEQYLLFAVAPEACYMGVLLRPSLSYGVAEVDPMLHVGKTFMFGDRITAQVESITFLSPQQVSAVAFN